MRARIPETIQRFRPNPSRRSHGRSDRSAAEVEPAREVEVEPVGAPSEPSDPEARVREAGGPEDHACYTCSCGMVFVARVSTSVACPHCGTDQAW